MHIIRDYADWPESLKGCAAAIGNFDGLHRGHERVLSRLLRVARQQNVPAAVITFEPHPRRFFQPDAAPMRIQNFAAKADMLREHGVNAILAQRFNKTFAHLSAEDFIQKVLIESLAVKALFTGEDFVFGHQRGGNALLLGEYAASSGVFDYEALSPAGDANEGKYSSSKIREHLRWAEMSQIAAMLGRPFGWQRRVIHGDARGRQIGFATANIMPPPLLWPRFGVYAVRARWPGGEGVGVANFGTRPTVDGQRTLLEVHVLDQSPDLYGQMLQVDFMAYLRDEQRFENLDALKSQIARDITHAREVLA